MSAVQLLSTSKATTPRDLQHFVFDTLGDALHHPLALGGAQPSLHLLLSRTWLPGDTLTGTELHALSQRLRRQGVPHDIDCVPPGDPEPATHQLRIHLI